MSNPPARGPYALVVGMQTDKDHAGFFGGLVSAAREVQFMKTYCYEVPGGRGATPAVVAAGARAAGLEAVECGSPEEALDAAMRDAGVEGGEAGTKGTSGTKGVRMTSSAGRDDSLTSSLIPHPSTLLVTGTFYTLSMMRARWSAAVSPCA